MNFLKLIELKLFKWEILYNALAINEVNVCGFCLILNIGE